MIVRPSSRLNVDGRRPREGLYVHRSRLVGAVVRPPPRHLRLHADKPGSFRAAGGRRLRADDPLDGRPKIVVPQRECGINTIGIPVNGLSRPGGRAMRSEIDIGTTIL